MAAAGFSIGAVWGGGAAIAPKTRAAVRAQEIVRVTAAGPIASFIVGGILIVNGYVFGNQSLLLTGAIFVIFGMMTAIPLRAGNVYSDGGKVHSLLSHGESHLLELSKWRITACVLARKGHYETVELTDIEVLQRAEDIRDRYLGCYYAWKYYSAVKEKQNALAMEERLKELSWALPVSLRKKLVKH